MARLKNEKIIELSPPGRSEPAPLHPGLEEVTRGIWGGFHRKELPSAVSVILKKYPDIEEIVVHMTARHNLQNRYGQDYPKHCRCKGCGFDAEDSYNLYVKRSGEQTVEE